MKRNDQTQLALSLDPDSRMSLLAAILTSAIRPRKRCLDWQPKPAVGTLVHWFYGQGPSDNPDFAAWLMQEGIESMSLNPDSVIDTWTKLAAM